MVAVYEVTCYLIDENIAGYMLQFCDLVSVSHNSMMCWEWTFDIMLDSKAFYSISIWLELEGYRLPVIVTGKKLACWHGEEIGHLLAWWRRSLRKRLTICGISSYLS